MPTVAELTKLSRSRLRDARILAQSARFDAAAYLCGYAIEIALKARICKTLGWREYPPKQNYQAFYTHSLGVLLHLSGRERIIKAKRIRAHWDILSRWDPESRYNAIGTGTAVSVRQMIESAKIILREI